MYAFLPMKFSKSLQCLAVYSLLALLSQLSHASDFDTLVGVYSFKSPYGNQEIDVVKVEKEGSQYIAYTNVSYAELEWSQGELAQPAKVEDYADLLTKKVESDSSLIGLETRKMAIFRLPTSSHSGQHKTNSGFLWISQMGALEVKKREPGK